jgi:hypothetical protein
MTNENQSQDLNEELSDVGADTSLPVKDELTALKERADAMGIPYHVSIGLEKLRDKVNTALNDSAEEEDDVTTLPAPAVSDELKVGATPEEVIAGYLAAQDANLTDAQKRNNAIKDANKLVRVRVNCMNPSKRDWEGEIFTISNSVVGTFKKFVPFNSVEGWHIPMIILHALRERQCQIFVNGVDANGRKAKRAQLISEFAIEVLPALTEVELKELAQRQLIATAGN